MFLLGYLPTLFGGSNGTKYIALALQNLDSVYASTP